MKHVSTLLLSCLFFIGCAKKELILVTPDNQSFAKNEAELTAVIQQQLTISGNPATVTKIESIQFFGDKKTAVAIIKYATDESAGNTIGLQRVYDSQNQLEKEIAITCKGTCNGKACSLEGIAWDPNNPDGAYVQCNCSDCKMSVTVTERSPKAAASAGLNIETLARKSYAETFNEYAEVKILSAKYNETESAAYTVYEYGFGKNISSFMIFRAKVDGLNAAGTPLARDKEVEIDCTGTCDCRERFIPSNSSIECTCSPCKMKVTTLTP